MDWRRIVAGAATILLGLLLINTASPAPADEPDRPNPPPDIQSIQELAELTLLEVRASEVITSEVTGYTGGTSAIVLVHGSVTLAVDLNQARYLEVDEERRRLVLGLPQPKIHRVAIDPETSRVLSCDRSGLWHLAMGAAHEHTLITDAMTIARERMLQAASDNGLTERARHHAEAVLARFVSEMGWTLEVRWDN
ncbi:MAG: DUF4230 domain-containing protein [Phycisphaeraceae bacterium]